MRKEPYGVGSFVHIIHRGTRGSLIVRDADDKNRFLLMLTHFNDEHQPPNWFRDINNQDASLFERPDIWPEQKKLVNIIAFCLLDNHFHLLLQEIRDGGISKFIQRLCTSMSYRYNLKYGECGSLFQGSFRSRTVDTDNYLRQVIAYVQLKNALDACEEKNKSAMDFEKSYDWACKYPYASLGDHLGIFKRPIIEKEILTEFFSPAEFKEFSREFLENRALISEHDNDIVPFEFE